jgi:hypothetical protein
VQRIEVAGALTGGRSQLVGFGHIEVADAFVVSISDDGHGGVANHASAVGIEQLPSL